VGCVGHHECQEVAGSSAPWYFLNETNRVRSRPRDVEEFINVNGDVFQSRGLLDAGSVEVARFA